MMGKKLRERVTAFLLAAAVLLSPVTTVEAETDVPLDDYEEIVATHSIDASVPSYGDYIAQFDDVHPDETYVVDAADYVRFAAGDGTDAKPVSYEDYEGMQGTSVRLEDEGLIEYEVDIKTGGFYELSLDYYPVSGNSADIQRAFFIDGELPYAQLALVEFQRVWKNTVENTLVNEEGILVKEWTKDNQGNDLKPSMTEAPEWMLNSYLYDADGYITNRLQVYLAAGKHTVTIVSRREPMLLRRLTLSNADRVATYAEKKAQWDAAGAKDTQNQTIRIEAENAVKASSQMLYPTQDQSSPGVYPASAKALLNNTIGGNSWRLINQWIEWEFDVAESGYYNISFHARQNFVKGLYVSRKIMIDGTVPFEELNDYGFKYEQTWRMDTLKDENGEAYKIYLEAGHHTLRMQTVLGEFSTIISKVQDCVTRLNATYRKIIRITGVSPDAYRDYQIEASLPEVKDELKGVMDELNQVVKELRAVTGRSSDKETALITMSDQLEELVKDPERFVKVISSYKVNVRALGTWVTSALEQPLLDTIYITAPGTTVKAKNNGFWSRIFYEFTRLYYSFVIDYNQIGNVTQGDTRSITLWVGSGRDQANVIKSLVDKTFTNQTGISVNVMIVDMGTLLQATLAGQGPDVAIQVGNDLPMNYGLRNAVADLSQFDDLSEVVSRFNKSAMEAFQFDGATYGLPETQTFPMMFYRKDILKELGLEVPKTWDEVKVVMTVLSKNQMEIGMLPGENIFAMILYQNGGSYYNEDASRSALDSDAAINAFKEYCEFYTDYKLDQATVVDERFRLGECPIIISDYTLYNNLQVSAPDIKGLWGMAPVPGVLREDGTIDNTVGSTGAACIMMEDNADTAASWEFLKWWTSAQTQIDYGREMESLMGSAARIATANLEAFEALPWPNTEREALMEQFSQVRGIPQVPGGYFSWRNVNNAFYRVTTLTNSVSPREELMDKVLLINSEIDYKRKEFGLSLYEEK